MSTVIDGSASVTINSGAILGITSGTAVASTSGTSIDFTSLPSWVKRITVMFNAVSTNGTNIPQIQIGSGSVVTTGYNSVAGYTYSTSTVTSSATSGFILVGAGSIAATFSMFGSFVLTNISGNTWVQAGILSNTVGTATSSASAGSLALSGTLDRVRITTVGSTDTFDAGSINILYE